MQIADHQQLHTAEGLRILSESSKYIIHSIEQIGPNHADLIDHEQVETANNLNLFTGKASLAVTLSGRAWNVQAKPQLEKRVERHAAGVNRRDSRGRSDDETF